MQTQRRFLQRSEYSLAVVLLLAAGPAALASPLRWQRSLQEKTAPSTLTVLQAQDQQYQEDMSTRYAETQHYQILPAENIRDRLLAWNTTYPDLIRVYTAQDSFGLPTAGTDRDCPFDPQVPGCLNYYYILQDWVAHPEGSDSARRLPQVFWSGEVHGDEQVGPTSVLEATQLLLDAATCESRPRPPYAPSSNTDSSFWTQEMDLAKSCRLTLNRFGISPAERQWLARLVTTRRIVVAPTANALGYYRRRREEGNIDPNRDFPYDLEQPEDCMQTVAARTINELYRLHLFQLSLTFHGGMEVIGYEWGAPSWMKYSSPDDHAQNVLAAAYSRFAGGWRNTRPYDYGPMNDLVYPVRGGMEDWAYAGAFDPERVIVCQPQTFGGYAAEKTTYNNSTLRAFNMLVETSNDKIPRSDLGDSDRILDESKGEGNGHVSRNMRLALLAADMVEPYVSIVQVNELVLTDDVVPLIPRNRTSCTSSKVVQVPASSGKVVVQWTVGGALHVDSTQLWYGRWSDVEQLLDCSAQPDSYEKLTALLQAASPIGAESGNGKYNPDGPPPPPFAASFDLRPLAGSNDDLVVVAAAQVDQSWMTTPGNMVQPALPPQSHVVNARTNPDWHHEIDTCVIQGRKYWISIPLTIVLNHDSGAKAPSRAGDQGNETWPVVETVELNVRLAESGSPDAPQWSSNLPTGSQKGGGIDLWVAMLALALLSALLLMAMCSLGRQWRTARRLQVRERISTKEVDDAADYGGNGYHDEVELT